eukprot:4416668-Prorocentrum_lima.AAC.1
MERVPIGDVLKRITMAETIHHIQSNQEFAQASNWVSALGGTKAGVYLLYGHPTWDRKFTVQNRSNATRLGSSNPAHF